MMLHSAETQTQDCDLNKEHFVCVGVAQGGGGTLIGENGLAVMAGEE